VLLVGEIIKFVYSAYKIASDLGPGEKPVPKLRYLLKRSSKMAVLAGIYGAMNILSFVSLRNISAGMFTVFAQLKILTTATCSSVMLRRSYSMTKWRALISLMMGVLLFSEPIWNKADNSKNPEGGNVILGTAAVLIEVTLSGFASIYFEKVIKTDPEQLGIWERNYQLAFGSIPIYIMFMLWEDGGVAGYFGGWSLVAGILALLGAAGGMLVALSIKHGDSILKTLATTGAIVLSATLDHYILGGPLTNIMCIAGVIVVLSICNYTFDASPPETPLQVEAKSEKADEEIALTRGTAAR
jgi:UDP-sugar transporter A1/2/3